MIQIVNDNLDEIATEHFKRLQTGIKKGLESQKDLRDLIFSVCSLEELIVSNPEKLEDISNKLEQKGISNFKKEANQVFNYEAFCRRTSKYKYYAYELAHRLGINVCPYCNRQYTFTVRNNSKDVTRPEFDHFLTKVKYPYLALSFFNLIPSCKICNSTLKRDNEWSVSSHIHPYIQGFGSEWKFSLKLKKGKGIDFIYGNEDAFEIYFKSKGNKKIERNIKDLKLIEIYNQHKDYVSDIIKNIVVYNDSYLENLYEQYEGTLFASKSDIYRMVFNNYSNLEDAGKRVLGKLTKDIVEELKGIDNTQITNNKSLI
ncbi:MAG: hypothetical protein KF870_04215 [Leadbetterella sp.]|nr:hypothetical protein [Leadbetterella sp.]